MASDRARVSYDPTRKWRGLIAQQGRVNIEADWNEASTIDGERDRKLTLDFVGPFGTPGTPAGYVVTQIGQTGDLQIGAGTLYVGGERLDLDGPVTYSAQPEWLDYSTDPLWVNPVPPQPTSGGGSVFELVYLLAYEQEVSAVEDPALIDVALGGPDTMQRLRIMQHFVRQPNIANGTVSSWWADLATAAPAVVFGGRTFDPTTMLLESTTTMEISFLSSSGTPSSPGQASTTAGYLGAENQLIRVQVVAVDAAGIPTVVWGFDDASFIYRVQAAGGPTPTTTAITLATAPVDSYHYPVGNQAVELLRDELQLTAADYVASPTGFVATVDTPYSATTQTLTIEGVPPEQPTPPGDYLPPAAPATPPGPLVTGVSPVVGVLAGGTSVTVIGSGFTGASSVNFGSRTGTGLSVQSDTQLTVNSPAGAQTGVVDITITTPTGTSATSAADQFTYTEPTQAPTVTGVTPDSGVLAGGTLVEVNGSGFTGASAVNFGTSPGVGVTLTSDNVLTVISPAGAAGTVDVTVVTPLGTSATSANDHFTFAQAPPPQVIAIGPTSGGLAGGTLVTVTGSAFTGATAVNFGSTPGGGVTLLSDTQLTVLSPPGAAGPAVDVTVVTPAGTSPTVPSDQFSYELEVTAVSPAAGPVSGGTTVTVIGSGFTGATAVSFGANPGSGVTVLSDSELTVTSPPGTGIVEVTVTTAAGGTSATNPSDQFGYEQTPQPYLRVWQGIATAPQGQSPSTAADGSVTVPLTLQGIGVNVTLISSNGSFHPGDFWRFALRPSTPTAVYPARFLAGPQPPDGPRTWICPLAMLTWAGDSASVVSIVPPFWNLVTLTAAVLSHVSLPAPAITGISPESGPPSGGTVVTVNGSGFTGTTAVHFGPNPGTALSIRSDTQLTVTSPAGSGVVDVTVTTSVGTSATVAADRFGYLAEVTGIEPAVGPPAGGTVVTVSGSGFTGATAVEFGGVSGTNLSVVSGSEIMVTSPAGSSVTDVTVTTPEGTSAASPADRFAYLEVTSVLPAGGPTTGGTTVVVRGSGFVDAGVEAVRFGGTFGAAPTVISDTELTTRSPGGRGTVEVTILAPLGGTATGPIFTYSGKGTLKDTTPDKMGLKDKTHKDKETISDLTTRKSVETKPPETMGSRAELRASAEEDGEEGEGRAFIEPEERPSVGDDVLDDEAEEDGEEIE